MNHRTIADLILNDAFELYGQPKWTFGKNTCNTYEVFVERIRLFEGETIPAWPVLDLIEKDEGLTEQFSNWFLEAAMSSAVELGAKANAHVTLSLNLLPHYAHRGTFPEDVLRLLEKTGFPANKLQFEISEAQSLSPQAIAHLNLLHDEHGIGLWLANFGTGHANVDVLREVHFDGIELDRTFAAHVPDDEQACRLVVAIQHLAHTLDLAVCAKGIETQEQFEFFEELDCFKGQGFLIGKPMRMPEMADYIDKYALKIGHD